MDHTGRPGMQFQLHLSKEGQSSSTRGLSPEPRGASNRVKHRHRSTSREPTQLLAQNAKEVLDYNRRGIVATANHGFGFITVSPAEGKTLYSKNLFVHTSSLIDTTLIVGELMSFDVAQGKKGYEAINVRKDTEEATRHEIPKRTISIEEVGDRYDRRGEVISYNVVYRYGIVKCCDNNITLLVHHSRFKPPLTEIKVGQILKFDIIEGPKGPCADQIEVVSGASIPSNDLHPPRNSNEGELVESNTETNLKQAVYDEFQCCICIKLLSKVSVVTNCDHYFCKCCIEQWLSERRRCPVCNARVVINDLKPLPRAFKNLLENVKNSK